MHSAVRFWQTDMQTNELKQELRKKLRARRNAIPAEQARTWSAAIVERIAASTAFQNADLLLLYAPIGSELDLLPLIPLAKARGIEVAFPVSHPDTCTLTFRILEDGAALVNGAYGIAEPDVNAREAIPTERTLCILPGLAFTPSGARIGYGKGYYDRFLQTFAGITAGAVYEKMLCKELPTEPHDLPVSLLFTERGMIRCHTRRAPQAPKNETALTAVGEKLRTWRSAHLPHRAKHEEQEKPSAALPKARAMHLPPALVLVTFLLLLLSRWIDTAFLNRDNEAVGVILLQILVFVIPAVGYSALRGEKFSSRIRIAPFRLEHLWFCACALAVMVFGSLLTSILTGGMESLTGGFVLYNTFTAQADGSLADIAALILSYAIVPAFCEELVFRAYLCAEYEHLGVGIAVTVSALFFAMLHFSFPLFLTYLFLGAVLGIVLYVTRSFFATLALHILYNLFCLFGQPYLTAFYLNAGSNDIFIFCIVTLCLLFAAFAAGEARKIYHLYARRNLSSDYTVPRPLKSYPKAFFRAVASPLSIICLIVWIVMSVINMNLYS